MAIVKSPLYADKTHTKVQSPVVQPAVASKIYPNFTDVSAGLISRMIARAESAMLNALRQSHIPHTASTFKCRLVCASCTMIVEYE